MNADAHRKTSVEYWTLWPFHRGYPVHLRLSAFIRGNSIYIF
jgi:hypothetical protein